MNLKNPKHTGLSGIILETVLPALTLFLVIGLVVLGAFMPS